MPSFAGIGPEDFYCPMVRSVLVADRAASNSNACLSPPKGGRSTEGSPAEFLCQLRHCGNGLTATLPL